MAEFASGLRYDDLPREAMHEVKRALLDFVGCALLGAQHKTVGVLLAHLERMRGAAALAVSDGVSVIGRGERVEPVAGAWVNGTMGHVYDFDDVHTAAGIHPGIIVVPAALAAAEMNGSSGREVVAAMAAGYEVAGRVGLATQLTHYEPGWHSTGTVGTLGAAAAAINLLRLDATQATHALGAAASHAAGLRVSFGSMVKPLHAGNACANGLQCASLAQLGLTGPLEGLEGSRGFFEVACGAIDQQSILTALGREYRFLRKGYKLYSCGGVVHPALDAVLALRGRLGTAYDRIRSMHAVVHPQVLEQMRIKEPRTGMQSKFSPFHAIAVTLLDGQALPAQFTDARAVENDVVALRQKVSIESSTALRKDETKLTVTLADGTRLEHHTEHARGYSPDNPPSDADLQQKFMSLAVPVLGDTRSAELAERIWGLDVDKNLSALMALCRSEAPAA
ncbi:MAG TPA: MmgE/PrpD family protein [Burkholderiales bacterium]|nr:MmgE/PrpD family protein [Burkholderiales bacterium]